MSEQPDQEWPPRTMATALAHPSQTRIGIALAELCEHGDLKRVAFGRYAWNGDQGAKTPPADAVVVFSEAAAEQLRPQLDALAVRQPSPPPAKPERPEHITKIAPPSVGQLAGRLHHLWGMGNRCTIEEIRAWLAERGEVGSAPQYEEWARALAELRWQQLARPVAVAG